MNDRQRYAIAHVLNAALGAPPAELTATRRHKKFGFILMSVLAVDR